MAMMLRHQVKSNVPSQKDFPKMREIFFWKHFSRQRTETNLKLSFKCPYVHISEWEHNNTVYFKGPLWGDIYQCFPTIYISGLLVNSTENSSFLSSFFLFARLFMCASCNTRGNRPLCQQGKWYFSQFNNDTRGQEGVWSIAGNHHQVPKKKKKDLWEAVIRD